MSDYSKSKNFGTNTYPVNSVATSDALKRVEPIMTAKLLKSRYLKGIDLSSYGDEELDDQIMLAMNRIELETGLPLTPTQYKERVPYDEALYRNFVYTKTLHGPVRSIEEFNIESSNGEHIFSIPPEWIEVGYLYRKVICVVPLLSTFTTAGLAVGNATAPGLAFLQAITAYYWIPAWWTIKYTAGLSCEGKLPVIVNELVGMEAALNILGMLQALITSSSQSISQDGISQASATKNGGDIYASRIVDLEAKKIAVSEKIKAIFNNKYWLSNI